MNHNSKDIKLIRTSSSAGFCRCNDAKAKIITENFILRVLVCESMRAVVNILRK